MGTAKGQPKRRVTYHSPKYLPLDGVSLDANIFIEEKSEAEYALGRLQGSGGEGFGKRFFNPELLISPLATKEATVSSKIEGTISTVSDVYKHEAGEKAEYSGTEEVANYRKAIFQAIALVKSGKRINKTYLKSFHKTLLTNVRHKGVLGDFRNGDVWIGEKETDPIEKAIYIPPKYIAVDGYMDNMFDYLEKGKEGPLMKVALTHYQFEAIHPFEDGNGRIGRLMIPLILFETKRISLPILYMSGYFDTHRDEYRESLHEVDETMQYEKWLKFFFSSVIEQLRETQTIITSINKLYDEVADQTFDYKSPYLFPFLAYIFEHPVFYPTGAEKALRSTYVTIQNLIRLFEKRGIIKEIEKDEDSDQRYKIYSFEGLIDLLTN